MEYKRACIINGYVYIHIPKCGGTSITGIKKHLPYHNWSSWYRYHGYNKFITTVRNPYTRWESVYSHLYNLDLTHSSFNNFTEDVLGLLIDGESRNIMKLMTPHPKGWHGIGKFMHKPQWSWIGEDVEVHKLEEHTIWNALNIKRRHENEGTYAFGKPVWDKNIRQVFERWFSEDFKRFNYEFSNSN